MNSSDVLTGSSIGHSDLDHLDLGWRRNDEGVAKVVGSLPHGGTIASAAPHWMGDGMEGDLMPYLAYYEVEVEGWKKKDEEPPYIPQVGNNCTSRGLGDGVDLMQFAEIAAGTDWNFIRTCIEACYAFGLYKAGMRGDNGCFGGAMAQGAHEIGLLPYTAIDGAHEETRDRLVSWAGNPKAIVDKYGEKASAFKVGSIAKVTTWEELCAAIANRRIVTMASNAGYNCPRDEKGICRRRGTWMHQMFIGAIIRSDGIETAVQFQSWGKNQPSGPRPFKLPSFSFRCLRQDVEYQLAQNDCWAIGLFPGFEKNPLIGRWTNEGWAA